MSVVGNNKNEITFCNFRDVKEGLDLLDQWDKRVIRAEMDMMVFLEDLDLKESLDCLE